MRAIIKPDALPFGYRPNHDQRRAIKRDVERKVGRKLTKEEFERILLQQRLKFGDIRNEDIRTVMSDSTKHYDNADVFPDGTEVMLNTKAISERKQSDLSKVFIEWVAENGEKVFHLLREDNETGLVCLEEDERYYTRKSDGAVERADRWLFDLFSDLLVRNDAGEWVEPWSIEESHGEYVGL